MASIVGVDLPSNKRGEIALTYIYGIGRSSARAILSEAGIDYDLKVKDWNDDQLGAVRKIIGTEYKVEGELRSSVQMNIKRLMDIVPSSFNNIIISLTHSTGPVISWSSAGKMGFRGSKKNTPYAAQMAAADCAKVAFDLGMRKAKVYVSGPGNGRESAIRSIHASGIEVAEIIDVTPLPHNGCRPPKRRRV